MLKQIISPICLMLIFTFAMFGQSFDVPNQNDDRPNIAERLGLEKEQIQKFRRLNAEHRPLIQAAQQKMREANRELDVAIYADNISDEIIRTKLREFQEAQAEVNRLRFMNEVANRRILTPEQLVRFRIIRSQYAESRDRQQAQPRQTRQNLNNIRNPNRQQRPNVNPSNVRPAANPRRPLN